jgi:hypothetical protein
VEVTLAIHQLRGALFETLIVSDDFFKGLRKWLAVAGDAARLPRLVSAVLTSYQRDGINVRRWQEVAS